MQTRNIEMILGDHEYAHVLAQLSPNDEERIENEKKAFGV